MPSPKAQINELADFAELKCWKSGSVSGREILNYLRQVGEYEDKESCDDSDDKTAILLDDVMTEIEIRKNACGSGYPFTLEREGTVVKCPEAEPEEAQSAVYLYLLLATRLNMKDDRIHAKIDGTTLLEPLSAHAIGSYLGSKKAESLVFGTYAEGGFGDKVDKLCEALCEGGGFKFKSEDKKAPARAKDDKLDVVVWIPFEDRLPGQLIVFAQCKTGTSWRDSSSELQIDIFTKRWIRKSFVVDPIRAFCVAEAVNRAVPFWSHTGVSSGILFDRCRLVEHCSDLPEESLSRVCGWTLEAKKTVPDFDG